MIDFDETIEKAEIANLENPEGITKSYKKGDKTNGWRS